MNLEEIIEKKKLKFNLDELYSKIKEAIKSNESQGMKVSKQVKNALKRLVYSIDNYSSYKLLEEKRYNITRYIPDKKQKYYQINEDLYIRLLEMISKRINNKENEYMFDSTIENDSITGCMSNINEISKKYKSGISGDLNDILEILENSDSELKVKSAIVLLKHINKIKDSVLEEKIISNLSNTNNEKKLKQIYTILNNNKYNFSNNINSTIKKIFDYIEESIISDKYDENLISIIDVLCSTQTIRKIDSLNNNIVELICHTNLHNYENENMELIIKLLTDKFIVSDNWFLRENIVRNILDIKFTSDIQKQLYLRVIEEVVFAHDNLENAQFQQRILDIIEGVQSTKSLELILNIYPFIDKYNNNDDKYKVIESLTNEKVKKLVIPVNNK